LAARLAGLGVSAPLADTLDDLGGTRLLVPVADTRLPALANWRRVAAALGPRRTLYLAVNPEQVDAARAAMETPGGPRVIVLGASGGARVVSEGRVDPAALESLTGGWTDADLENTALGLPEGVVLDPAAVGAGSRLRLMRARLQLLAYLTAFRIDWRGLANLLTVARIAAQNA
jgi:hypothetical protein